MLNLVDVLTCKRMMVYDGSALEYTTGLSGEVYLNTQDILHVLQRETSTIEYMDDLLYVLRKYDCITKAMAQYEDIVLVNYLYDNNINMDSIVRLTEKLKLHKLNKFLNEAQVNINRFGFYNPFTKFDHYDRRRNQEKNLADTLDMDAIREGAMNLGMYEDQLYVDVAEMISTVVFGENLGDLRARFYMYYEDRLSDYITDFEFDMVAYCCKLVSYMLRYWNVGLYGMEVFIRGALNEAVNSSNVKDRNRTTPMNESNTIQDIFNKATYGNVDYEEDTPSLKKRVHLSDDEINEFKKYM